MPEASEANQRVTNAKIFAKLESMEERMVRVEGSTNTTAAHSIRCGVRWDLYDKSQIRQAKTVSDKAETNRNTATIAGGKQLAIISAVVAVVVAIVNAVSLVIIQGLIP